MRKASLIASFAVAAFLCAGIATAAGTSTVVHSGNVEMTFGESFVPKALSRTVPTPIALRLWSRIRTLNGFPTPPLSEFVFDADENSAIDVRGLPTCSGGSRDIRGSDPRDVCGNTIVGEGTASFVVHFPDQPPVPAKSGLTIFNGGAKAGVTTLYAHAPLTLPTPTGVVMPIRIERIQEGRFASRATVEVPKIAGGAGSLTSFNATIGKDFVRNGKTVSVLTAKCPSGKIRTRAEAKFSDGTSIRSRLVRNCVPRD